MKINAILFDIGAVLIELDFNRFFTKLQLTPSSGTHEAIDRINQWEEYDRFERGQLTPKEFFDWMKTKTGHLLAEEDFWGAWNSILLEPVAGAPALLENLKSKLPLFALTNANPVHFQKVMTHYPMFQHFTAIYSSHLIGVRKPEIEIYRFALEQMKVPAEHILFIDDREENVVGARSVGLTAEVCLKSAKDLPKILNKYNLL